MKDTGHAIHAAVADVWERNQLRDALEPGVAEFGRPDIVVANAGILPMAMDDPHESDFIDTVDVDLIGVMNAAAVGLSPAGARRGVVRLVESQVIRIGAVGG